MHVSKFGKSPAQKFLTFLFLSFPIPYFAMVLGFPSPSLSLLHSHWMSHDETGGGETRSASPSVGIIRFYLYPPSERAAAGLSSASFIPSAHPCCRMGEARGERMGKGRGKRVNWLFWKGEKEGQRRSLPRFQISGVWKYICYVPYSLWSGCFF